MAAIAMIVSTVGYHWEEVFGAYWAFRDGGATVSLFTVDGAPPVVDPRSVQRTGPASLFGLGVSRRIAPDTDRGRKLSAALQSATKLPEWRERPFDAVFLPGGHGCLFDVNRNEALHAFLAAALKDDAPIGAVCHSTSTLAFVKEKGKSVLDGIAATGFPAPLDRLLIALGLVDARFLPLPLVNDDELRRAGAKLSALDVFEACINPRTLRDATPIVTGVGPKASARVARRVLKALTARRRVGETSSEPPMRRPLLRSMGRAGAHRLLGAIARA